MPISPSIYTVRASVRFIHPLKRAHILQLLTLRLGRLGCRVTWTPNRSHVRSRSLTRSISLSDVWITSGKSSLLPLRFIPSMSCYFFNTKQSRTLFSYLLLLLLRDHRFFPLFIILPQPPGFFLPFMADRAFEAAALPLASYEYRLPFTFGMSALPFAASLTKPTVRILGCLRELLHLSRRSGTVRPLTRTTSWLRRLEVGTRTGIDSATALGSKTTGLGLASIPDPTTLHGTLFPGHVQPPEVRGGGRNPHPRHLSTDQMFAESP